MARKPTVRLPSEHLSVLTRITRQIDADPDMSVQRRNRIKKYLSLTMGEFEKEMIK